MNSDLFWLERFSEKSPVLCLPPPQPLGANVVTVNFPRQPVRNKARPNAPAAVVELYSKAQIIALEFMHAAGRYAPVRELDSFKW